MKHFSQDIVSRVKDMETSLSSPLTNKKASEVIEDAEHLLFLANNLPEEEKEDTLKIAKANLEVIKNS